ncbi:MAG TPA: hypothetical protein VMG58_04845 [Candidatus Sulfotelmatobacter sp.]|nr:hypothetical protein [Candidatus Sulfotelmatobacter sp.]
MASLQLGIGLLDGKQLAMREILELRAEVGHLVRMVPSRRAFVSGLDLRWSGVSGDFQECIWIHA